MRQLARHIVLLTAAAALGSAPSFAGPPTGPASATSASASASARTPALTPAVLSDAGVEYFIARAAQLTKGDHRARLDELTQMLATLKAQKQQLVARLAQLEAQLAGAEQAGKGTSAQSLRDQITAAKAALAGVDIAIKNVMQELEKLRSEDEAADAEVRLTESALARILASLESAHESDRAIWQGLAAAKKRDQIARLRRALQVVRTARDARALARGLKPAPSVVAPSATVIPK
jgi:hypothetical protein